MEHVVCDGRRFAFTEVFNYGEGNNCLGLALRGMLLTSPQGLRRALVDFLREPKPDAVQDLLLLAVLDDMSGDLDRAAGLLEAGAFLPSDLFFAYMRYGRKAGVIKDCNVVLFMPCHGTLVPVTSYYASLYRPTHYIACAHFHFTELQLEYTIGFDKLYFHEEIYSKV